MCAWADMAWGALDCILVTALTSHAERSPLYTQPVDPTTPHPARAPLLLQFLYLYKILYDIIPCANSKTLSYLWPFKLLLNIHDMYTVHSCMLYISALNVQTFCLTSQKVCSINTLVTVLPSFVINKRYKQTIVTPTLQPKNKQSPHQHTEPSLFLRPFQVLILHDIHSYIVTLKNEDVKFLYQHHRMDSNLLLKFLLK